jgi:hypothetical protein
LLSIGTTTQRILGLVATKVITARFFEISYGTSSWSSFWRLLLPLSVLMAMVLLVFKVRPDEQDARASIPVTVLLTLVFLQQTYRDKLPDLPFLTFLDQVYVVAYVVTLAAFVFGPMDWTSLCSDGID